ncbi:hypothetical protein GCM10009541_35240 [Micromonospora gifhornensis]|uniref:Uncharacterized protein n=1 Tax=Micromonospora gifhornensis TaxID=84594 RepID=A0ABQ4IJM8_9ACTN|nr:hypothetical protein [Micromonospora gifhornensis]GIJ18114.1 hypothetical protein Vgi01_47980 [Micromonospora gifhornensis]
MTEIGLTIETAGEALVLRSGGDSRVSARITAEALLGHPGRTAVLSTPEVTRRADLFDWLPAVLTEHLGGSAGGVTLVALGDYAATASVVDRAQELADWIGQNVVVPVPALGTESPQSATWVLCEPGRPARDLPDVPAGAVWRTPAGHTLVLATGFTEDGRPAPAR